MNKPQEKRQPRSPWRMLRGVGIVAVGMLVVWAWYQLVHGIRLSPPEKSPMATPLDLVDPWGDEVSLESFRGKVVVINLWASWCPPCRAEVPRLNRIAAANGDEVVVLGVNVERLDRERLARVRTELGIDYRVVVPAGQFSGTFDWNGLLPYTWLVDKRGRVRAAHGGLPVEGSLRRACEELRREVESVRSTVAARRHRSGSRTQSTNVVRGGSPGQLDARIELEVEQRSPAANRQRQVGQ